LLRGGAQAWNDHIAVRVDTEADRVAAAVLDHETAAARRLDGNVLRRGIGERKRTCDGEREQGRMQRLIARHDYPQ
jgi:hypothetical protein